MVTAVTAQNTKGVFGVHNVPEEIVGQQMDAVFEDLAVDVVKIGMVASVDTIGVIAEKIEKYNVEKVVVDPVMVAESGDALVGEREVEASMKMLFPLARVITPNLFEAAKLVGGKIAKDKKDMKKQAKKLAEMGAEAVLLKGGHRQGGEACDLLVVGGENIGFVSHLWRQRIHTGLVFVGIGYCSGDGKGNGDCGSRGQSKRMALFCDSGGG